MNTAKRNACFTVMRVSGFNLNGDTPEEHIIKLLPLAWFFTHKNCAAAVSGSDDSHLVISLSLYK